MMQALVLTTLVVVVVAVELIMIVMIAEIEMAYSTNGSSGGLAAKICINFPLFRVPPDF